MPVAPTSSLTDPTWVIQPAETVGLSWRSTIKIFIPLSRKTSWTGTLASWAVTANVLSSTSIISPATVNVTPKTHCLRSFRVGVVSVCVSGGDRPPI